MVFQCRGRVVIALDGPGRAWGDGNVFLLLPSSATEVAQAVRALFPASGHRSQGPRGENDLFWEPFQAFWGPPAGPGRHRAPGATRATRIGATRTGATRATRATRTQSLFPFLFSCIALVARLDRRGLPWTSLDCRAGPTARRALVPAPLAVPRSRRVTHARSRILRSERVRSRAAGIGARSPLHIHLCDPFHFFVGPPTGDRVDEKIIRALPSDHERQPGTARRAVSGELREARRDAQTSGPPRRLHGAVCTACNATQCGATQRN